MRRRVALIVTLAALVATACSSQAPQRASLNAGATTTATSQLPPADLDDGCHPSSPTTVAPDTVEGVTVTL